MKTEKFKTLSEKQLILITKIIDASARNSYAEVGDLLSKIINNEKEFIKRQLEEIDRDLYYEKEQGLLCNKSYFRALHKVRDKLVKDAGEKLNGN